MGQNNLSSRTPMRGLETLDNCNMKLKTVLQMTFLVPPSSTLGLVENQHNCSRDTVCITSTSVDRLMPLTMIRMIMQ